MTEVTPWGSVRVLETRLDLLAAAVEGPLSLGSFTDEELAGLEDPTQPPAAPSPWLAGLSQGEAETALTAALRGLSARGLYRAIPVSAQEQTFAVEADPQLLALLSLRRDTACIVVAERRGAAIDWVLLYGQRAGLWLAETVFPTGIHAFTLATAEHHCAVLTDWSGAWPDAPRPGPDVTLTRAEISAQGHPVEGAELSVTVTRFGPGAGETWSQIFTSRAGAWLVTPRPDQQAHYQGATRERIHEHWEQTLDVILETQ